MTTSAEKLCKKCGLSKPLDQFHKDMRKPDGKRHVCKTCVVAIDAARCDMPKIVPLEKACTKCHQIKAIDEFSLSKARKDGHGSRCKACVYSRQAMNRAKHRKKATRVMRLWRVTHPERTHLHYHAYQARKRQLPTTWTVEQIVFMFDYWQHACAVCGNPRGLFWKLSRDHWIPITSPDCPGTIATNMVPLCLGAGGCNNSKGNLDPHTWLVRRFGTKKAAVVEQKIAAYFALVAQTFQQAS